VVSSASWPGLTRPSTPCFLPGIQRRGCRHNGPVPGRAKPDPSAGHDERRRLDCFVACAPRNDGKCEAIAHHLTRFQPPALICPSCHCVADRAIDHIPKSPADSRPSRALPGGALRDRHECRVRDAVDVGCARDECAGLRTAKSCGSGLSTLRSSRRQCLRIAPATVTKKPDHREEREGNR